MIFSINKMVYDMVNYEDKKSFYYCVFERMYVIFLLLFFLLFIVLDINFVGKMSWFCFIYKVVIFI